MNRLSSTSSAAAVHAARLSPSPEFLKAVKEIVTANLNTLEAAGFTRFVPELSKPFNGKVEAYVGRVWNLPIHVYVMTPRDPKTNRLDKAETSVLVEQLNGRDLLSFKPYKNS